MPRRDVQPCQAAAAIGKLVLRDALTIPDLNVSTRVVLNQTEFDVVQTVLREVHGKSNSPLCAAADCKTYGADAFICDRLTMYRNPHHQVIVAIPVQGTGWRGHPGLANADFTASRKEKLKTYLADNVNTHATANGPSCPHARREGAGL